MVGNIPCESLYRQGYLGLERFLASARRVY